MRIVLLVLQVICALGLIVTILLQSAKSAGMGGMMGGGGSDGAFGKQKGLDALLSKVSVTLAVGFMLFTFILSFVP